jgi:hypothetical protein
MFHDGPIFNNLVATHALHCGSIFGYKWAETIKSPSEAEAEFPHLVGDECPYFILQGNKGLGLVASP